MIRMMQIKATLRCHYSLIRFVNIPKFGNTLLAKQLETYYIAGESVNLYKSYNHKRSNIYQIFKHIYFFYYLFIYLAVSGLSCSMQDLRCGTRDLSLWCAGSLVVARGL